MSDTPYPRVRPGRPSSARPLAPPAPWQADALTTGQLAVGTALAAVFAYQISFNLLPDGIRIKLAALIAACILMVSVGSLFLRPQLWRLLTAATLLGVGLCWLLSEGLGVGQFELMPAVRFMLPLWFGIWLLEYRAALRPRWVLAMCIGVLLFALAWVALHPQEFVNNLMRFSPFTGGEDGAHASAYLVALCALAVHQLRLNGEISGQFAWSLLAIAAVLLIGLRVATPIFMLINYGLVHVLLTRRLSSLQKAGIWLLMVLGIVAVLVWHEALQIAAGGSTGHIENLGSGRIGTWLHRIELLGQRDLLTLLVGTGPGSDVFTSPIWWWEGKDSHNDLLMLTIEIGLLGLSLWLACVYFLLRGLGRGGLPLAWFFLSGALISNALVGRPYLACLFWISVALAGQRRDLHLWRVRRRRQRRRLRPSPGPDGPGGGTPSRRAPPHPAAAHASGRRVTARMRPRLD